VRARTLRTTSTDAERALWQALRSRQLGGYKFRRQHPVGRYFADFACVEAGLIVELDGGQHFEPVAARADAERTAALRALGFHVLRYTNREALAERDTVLADILNWLNSNHPHPNPLPPAGEGVRNRTGPLPHVGEGAGNRTGPLQQGGEGAGDRTDLLPQAGEGAGNHTSPFSPAGEGAGNHLDSLPPAGEEANTKEPSHG
jgi:very-short-patch-repair endonuclease